VGAAELAWESVIATTPVLTALLAMAVGADTPNAVKLIGAFVSFAGVALVIAIAAWLFFALPRDASVAAKGLAFVASGIACALAGGASAAVVLGLGLGKVPRAGHTDTDLYQQVQVDPFVDFGSLAAVLVLVPTERRR